MPKQKGSIIYSLVARKKTVLAEHAVTGGNFIQISRVILEKIVAKVAGGGKMSYAYGKYFFHYDATESVVFMCMTSSGFSRSSAFAFLADVKRRFMSSYGAVYEKAMAFEMNEEFSRVLSRQMEYFSDPYADRMEQVQEKLAETKTIMTQNIDHILDRGEHIELLVNRTDGLVAQSYSFKGANTKLKYLMLLKNVKLWIVIVILVVVSSAFCYTLTCGPIGFILACVLGACLAAVLSYMWFRLPPM